MLTEKRERLNTPQLAFKPWHVQRGEVHSLYAKSRIFDALKGFKGYAWRISYSLVPTSPFKLRLFWL